MSFSTRMKDDLARVISSRSCCRRAEFLAFFLINGNIRIGKGMSLVMNTEHSASARKMYTLAKDFGLEREVSAFRRSRLRKNQVYTLEIPAQEQMRTFLSELGLVDEEIAWRLDFTEAVRERFLQESCCRRAYLRGAFLAAGKEGAWGALALMRSEMTMQPRYAVPERTPSRLPACSPARPSGVCMAR